MMHAARGLVHHLIQTLGANGKETAAARPSDLGGLAETTLALCQRFYAVCERGERSSEALAYNNLVQRWLE